MAYRLEVIFQVPLPSDAAGLAAAIEAYLVVHRDLKAKLAPLKVQLDEARMISVEEPVGPIVTVKRRGRGPNKAKQLAVVQAA